ncbi:MAG: DUF3299 domain-containing protein [Bacteroidota bacterium]
MKRYLYLSLLLLLTGNSWSAASPTLCFDPPAESAANNEPIPIPWTLLTSTTFELTYNEKIDVEAYAPKFPEVLERLNGELVEIKGYVIPYDESQEAVALSANPYAACFFCGKASPASILTLRFAKPGKRYKVDAYLSFRGRLRLNYDDPDEFYFVLDDAVEL